MQDHIGYTYLKSLGNIRFRFKNVNKKLLYGEYFEFNVPLYAGSVNITTSISNINTSIGNINTSI